MEKLQMVEAEAGRSKSNRGGLRLKGGWVVTTGGGGMLGNPKDSLKKTLGNQHIPKGAV